MKKRFFLYIPTILVDGDPEFWIIDRETRKLAPFSNDGDTAFAEKVLADLLSGSDSPGMYAWVDPSDPDDDYHAAREEFDAEIERLLAVAD